MNDIDTFIAWAERELKQLDESILGGLATDESYRHSLARRLIWLQVIDKAKHIVDHDSDEFV
jgi:hypothetical protein